MAKLRSFICPGCGLTFTTSLKSERCFRCARLRSAANLSEYWGEHKRPKSERATAPKKKPNRSAKEVLAELEAIWKTVGANNAG